VGKRGHSKFVPSESQAQKRERETLTTLLSYTYGI
jgi:hypothetical protein